jgi:DNA segregation ATPase FtsK/SpoIIIE-like protein
MLRRYEILESYKAENIEEYKELGHSMGYIVLFIDELADLMMRSKETKKELEQSIARL